MKSSCFDLFGNGKCSLFLSKEVDRKMIFTFHWEILVLNFSVMGNTVFFSAKMLMERWYLLGISKLSMIFQGLGNMVSCSGIKKRLADHTWEWNQILCDFFFIASENFRYFLFNPSKFHISFVPIFLENPSPGITNFVTSFEQTNFWSWDTKENNLEYLLFGINTNLLAICSWFSLFCRYLKKTLKPTKFYSRFWIRRKLTL